MLMFLSQMLKNEVDKNANIIDNLKHKQSFTLIKGYFFSNVLGKFINSAKY